MAYTLKKTFRFESAHRLAKNYPGKCKNIHGHSWNGNVEVTFEKLGQYDMAMDFSILKVFLKKLEDNLDHKLWLWELDEDFVQMANFHNMEIVTFESNPTSEVVAKYIWQQACAYLITNKIGFESVAVTVDETCTSSCRYSE